ncbi:LysR substrate-binding domain-containing protein [Bordetella sp. BOR01]|uniref:LysR family transcriptional regulator n=1 Tax=Bordetella sp. BOR01 TaxID=2854779 RepID=UPI001C43AEAE|nr:LysR substrate-binding domain-containing protein [Bordetella sp. BOR01]MBV7484815.1 LysR family transcriptional regulator [Bordetella sp. BOR01]
MELRQLRYFITVCELGSMGRAALDLGTVPSTLSQQISRLESELSTRLLHRTPSGVAPTDAGVAFLRHAQLVMRHANDAARAAKTAQLSGHASVGLPPTTASLLGVPLVDAAREQYPDIKLHLVEALSGHLISMLNTGRLDMAVLFNAESAHRLRSIPLLTEKLFLVGRRGLNGMPAGGKIAFGDMADIPLVMPSRSHGLRATVEACFNRMELTPRVVLEIDSLVMLMDTVSAGIAASIQPGAAMARYQDSGIVAIEIADAHALRRSQLISLNEEEMSPAGLALRSLLRKVIKDVIGGGKWIGASLHEAG